MDRFQLAVRDIALEPLDAAAALEFVSDPTFGGNTLFVGRVRDHNLGRSVSGISYDIYAPLALATFQRIAEDIDTRHGPALRLHISHAHGRLHIGDIAVVVAAGSAHRDLAFTACRELIEAVKYSAPVWKQEHYLNGDSEWSDGSSLLHARSACSLSDLDDRSENCSESRTDCASFEEDSSAI